MQLKADPYSTEAFDQIPHLRDVAKQAGGEDVLIGGPDGEYYDLPDVRRARQQVIIPIALVVVFLILAFLLRAIYAPAMLVVTIILSSEPRSGSACSSSRRVRLPGEDPSLPLLTFVFLVALGIDYNIFLMARVREETPAMARGRGCCAGSRSPAR